MSNLSDLQFWAKSLYSEWNGPTVICNGFWEQFLEELKLCVEALNGSMKQGESITIETPDPAQIVLTYQSVHSLRMVLDDRTGLIRYTIQNELLSILDAKASLVTQSGHLSLDPSSSAFRITSEPDLGLNQATINSTWTLPEQLAQRICQMLVIPHFKDDRFEPKPITQETV